jgi:hypothetical protein
VISLPKPIAQASILGWRNDCFAWLRYPSVMAEPGHEWYLAEWLATLGKKQADIVRDLDWNKARISLMLRGKQPYDRDSLNELAADRLGRPLARSCESPLAALPAMRLTKRKFRQPKIRACNP